MYIFTFASISDLHQYSLRDHPYITSAKGLSGSGQKMACFADVQYCIYADILDRWVRKSPKISRRNIGMVPLCAYSLSYVKKTQKLGNFHKCVWGEAIFRGATVSGGWGASVSEKQKKSELLCAFLRHLSSYWSSGQLCLDELHCFSD